MLGRSSVLLGLLLTTVTVKAQAVTVSVSATASHPIPTTLWGQMYEDISHSGDGGLYAEMLQNRAFQQVTPGTDAALYAWSAINNASISVVQPTVSVSSALPNALELTIPSGSTGAVGFANGGYYGLKFTEKTTYTASFYYRFPNASSFHGDAVVSLQTTAGEILASKKVHLSGAQTHWREITLSLRPSKSATSLSNQFAVTIDGRSGAQTIQFAMFSLFPPTFKNRKNGMRADIATALAEMKPAFFRFPGGNNLEGETIESRWRWNETLGPLVDRPGRVGDWGYINTDGLGLLEYLEWCEDVGMEPIMAVWAGYALGRQSVAEADLGPYIQDAIDQINFVIGHPANSTAAAKRAALGHPRPFKLNFVEIGNEDFIGSAPGTYTYRWPNFVNALKAEFPDISFIATSRVNNPVLTPKPTHYDVHVYQTPKWFRQNSFYYDSFARDGTKYFEGEYAAISTNSSNLYGTPETGRLLYPTMQSSCGEATFMTGLERNSDIVFAASYAPLLNHVSGSQWTPNLVSFDSGAVYRSTSYYVQKLFSLNRGDEYLPSTLPDAAGTLFWSVVRKNSTQEIIIKVVNNVQTSAPVTFALPFSTVATSATVQVLAGNATDSNTPTSLTAVAPQTTTITTGATFDYSAPGFSVSVITVKAQ